jgi:microcompartment protein CcmL/EutN
MDSSYGFIETRGYIAAVEAADAMVKTAQVRLIKLSRIGSALVTVIVEGPLDACQAAVSAGSAAAEKVGELVSAHVIPRPDNDLAMFTSSAHGPAGKQKRSGIKKSTKTVMAKPAPSVPNQEPLLINFIGDAVNGITLNELSTQTNKDKQQIRLQLKQLMDENKIEKVQQKYFLIKKGKRK